MNSRKRGSSNSPMGWMRWARAAALAVALAAPSAAPGQPVDADAENCVDAGIRAIQDRYEKVRGLRADFVQTTRPVALASAGGPTTSRGSVQFAKPGRMRWSYREPEPSLVVSDGKTLWLYDPTHQEVQRMTFHEGVFSGAAIQFLLGQGNIQRDFRVTDHECAETFVELELVPRSDASYEKLRVRADLPGGDLVRTELTDLLGNQTRVDFSGIRANLDPPGDVFAFDPPDGVAVIDLDAPAAP